MLKGVLPLAAIATFALLGSGAATAASDDNAPAAADDVVTVAPLFSRIGEAPLPKVGEGAPNWSPEQVDAMTCMKAFGGVMWSRISDASLKAAYDTTVQARQVRIDAFNGVATQAQIDQAELARQAAVAPVPLLRERMDRYAPQSPDLKVDETTYKAVDENARKILDVSFVVHNLTTRRIELPPVVLAFGDVNGFVLATQTMALDALFIEPGANMPVTLAFDNPPAYAATLVARFQAQTRVDIYHDCAPLDAQEMSQTTGKGKLPAVQTKGSTPAPVSPAGAPNYSAGELAVLESLARTNAGSVIGDGRTATCDSPGHRRWRDLLVQADDLETAWETAKAADDIRQGAAKGIFLPQDVAAADLARQNSMNTAFSARLWSPVKPTKYSKLTLAAPSVAFTPARSGLIVSGEISGDQASGTPPIRISALDANGLVISEIYAIATPPPTFLDHQQNPTPAASGGTGDFGGIPPMDRPRTRNLRYEVPLTAVPNGYVSRIVVEFAC